MDKGKSDEKAAKRSRLLKELDKNAEDFRAVEETRKAIMGALAELDGGGFACRPSQQLYMGQRGVGPNGCRAKRV